VSYILDIDDAVYSCVFLSSFYPALYSPVPHNPALAAPATRRRLGSPGHAPITETEPEEDRYSAGGQSGTFGKVSARKPERVVGSFDHAILPMPPRKTLFPAMGELPTYYVSAVRYTSCLTEVFFRLFILLRDCC